MKRAHKVWFTAASLLIVTLAFATWYRFHFAMAPALEREVQGSASAPKVLIATQGSEFKNAVVERIAASLESRSATFKVIDVSGLGTVDANAWNAVVVLHTWEMRRPPPAVREFVDRTTDKNRLIVLTTSGDGRFKLEGVDAISAASEVVDADEYADQVNQRLAALLDVKGAGSAP
jgi:hypothetical protein